MGEADRQSANLARVWKTNLDIGRLNYRLRIHRRISFKERVT